MRAFAVAPPLLLALLSTACMGGGADPDVVAEAADQEWTVAEAATLIAPDADLPADPAVVEAMANLWIDYTLLATAAVEDAAMSHVDVSPVVQELVEERLLATLRDSVIQIDTATTEELERQYAAEAPGSLVRVRHVLLAWPDEATPAQRDSVLMEIQALRQRIVDAGEDFATVARQFSQDPATAPTGGDLGLLSAPQLLPPLRSAAFALAPGEVSEPVESPYGMHLLQVAERHTPSRERFRADHINRRVAQAESIFVAGLESDASLQIADGAAGTVRELALNPRTPLGRMEEIRALVRYEGGEVTMGEAQRHLQNLSPAERNQVALAHDDAIANGLLRSLAHRELLLDEARRRGWAIREDVQARLNDAARGNLAEAARQLGLSGIPVSAQETREEAVSRAVTELMSAILSGERRQVTPLGAMSHVLRAQYPAEVNESGVARAVERIQEVRSGGGAAPAE